MDMDLNINTILQIATIVVMAIGGFWFRMIFNKLETRQSKEICKILMDQNEKDHCGIETQMNGMGQRLSKKHGE